MIKKQVLTYAIGCWGLLAATIIHTGHVVFVLGPSCSGKTTVSYQLARELGAPWKVVSYDQWEAYIGRSNAPASTIFAHMINEVHDKIKAGYDVVVDANRYFPDARESLVKAGNKCTNIYLYAPLKVLVKRCKKRLKAHNHGQKWSKSIRKFLQMTFEHFYPHDMPEQTDGLIINTAQVQSHEVVRMIKTRVVKWKQDEINRQKEIAHEVCNDV